MAEDLQIFRAWSAARLDLYCLQVRLSQPAHPARLLRGPYGLELTFDARNHPSSPSTCCDCPPVAFSYLGSLYRRRRRWGLPDHLPVPESTSHLDFLFCQSLRSSQIAENFIFFRIKDVSSFRYALAEFKPSTAKDNADCILELADRKRRAGSSIKLPLITRVYRSLSLASDEYAWSQGCDRRSTLRHPCYA